ncbi:restriction endonuclease subunit S [Chryseobacterium sp. 5_R23647]|uniref:restriction endonuclease subunit S n=1 Tax=Chryseobacterium sp. 5_R23647 TaxID=2258964 RepID=UPI001402BF3B|nr:restriction endonuclease subunit S [Chryseobacterium sp. 5_R23647]
MKWEVKKLGDIGKASMCKRIMKHETSTEGEIPFYKIGTFGKKPDAYIPSKLYESYRSKYSFPKKGDILISASGTIGRRVIYDGEPAYFQDSNIVWIDNDESQVLNKYLYKFYGFCNWNPSKGATISRLYNDDLRNILLPFPSSISEQQKIVEKLDAAFELIDQAKANIEKNIQNAKDLFQSKLNQVFSQRGDGWEEKKLLELILKTKNINPKDFENREYKYIDVSSVDRKTLKITEFSSINSQNAPSRARKSLLENDIIFATVRPTLKRVCLISKEFDNEICSTGYVVLRSNQNLLKPKMIFYFLQTSAFMEKMEDLQKGASYPAVTDGEVKDQKIMIPSNLHHQQEIVIHLDEIANHTDILQQKYQQKLANLEELRKSILEKAFKGELV